jgi:ankyrin repeat protein
MAHAGDALVWAVMASSVEKVTHLLEDDATLVHAAGGPLHETPLHAAVLGECVEVLRLLVKGGARLEEHNRYGATPLLTAAACGHSQVGTPP